MRPRKLKILGKTHDVVYVAEDTDLIPGEILWGLYEFEKKLITLCGALNDEDVFEVMLYEVLHRIEKIASLNLGEKRIERLAVYLADFLLTNKIVKL